MSSPYDFRKPEDVKEYLHNIGIEYRFGCYSENRPEVCHLLGMYLETIKTNVEQAKKVFKVNCDNSKWNFSCWRYAYLLDHENKDNNPEKKEEALKYYIAGCDNNLNKACLMAGVRTGGKAEKETNPVKKKELYETALKYMDKGCTDNLGMACFNLASIYFDGTPDRVIKRDLKKALNYSVKGCDCNHMPSCLNASLMFLKGDGTEKDEKQSMKYRRKAEELEKALSGKQTEIHFGVGQ